LGTTRVLLPALRARNRRWFVVGTLLAAVAGCSYGITVRRVSDTPLLADWRASAVEEDELSARTRQTLQRLDLAKLYQRHPAEAFARLHDLALAIAERAAAWWRALQFGRRS
jgi:hypothetical protein